MGLTWGPAGTDRAQVGPMWAPWKLLSGYAYMILNGFRAYQMVCFLSNLASTSFKITVAIFHSHVLQEISTPIYKYLLLAIYAESVSISRFKHEMYSSMIRYIYPLSISIHLSGAIKFTLIPVPMATRRLGYVEINTVFIPIILIVLRFIVLSCG